MEIPDVEQQLLITFDGNKPNLGVCKHVCSLNENLGSVCCCLFSLFFYAVNKLFQ